MNKRKMNYSNNKPKDTKYVIAGLWKYICHHKIAFFIAISFSILSNLFALIGPFLSGEAIDAIALGTGNVDFDIVIRCCALMVAFYILSAIMSFILSVIMIKISQKITTKMRNDVFEKLSTLPVSYFDKNQIGDILSKMSYDIDTINTSLSSDLVVICSSVTTVIGSLIMMIIISPLLVIIFIFTIPVSLLFTKFTAKKVRPLYRLRSRKLGELNGFVEERLTGYKTIKAYSREDKVLADFDKINLDASNASYKAEYWSISGPFVTFINNISLSLISIFGAILFIFKQMTIGQIGSFVAYSRKFSGPINEAANLVAELQSAFAAAERVFKLLDSEEEVNDIEDAISLENVSGEISFNNISFGYNPDQIIINDFSYLVQPGKTIAIVGATGAGKTTLINLLMRFYDVTSGEIDLDNNNINNIVRKDLRSSYSMVLQDTWLFNGTIFENIIYGKENATLEDCIRVCKAAHIHDYVMSLPLEYNTMINDSGVNLSKGQKQLLTIARAMLIESKMLIFDEATSNVDTMTELKIQSAMLNIMKDKTSFIIAHRLSTIKDADAIIVLNKGDIMEVGNHRELITKKGFYYTLYNSQFE